LTDVDIKPTRLEVLSFDFEEKAREEYSLSKRDQLKHYWACVRFKGCSSAFTHQLVRHRLIAISQESQRYCDEKGFFENDYFVIPKSIREAASYIVFPYRKVSLNEWYTEQLQEIDEKYRKLQQYLGEAKAQKLTTGKVNEDARFLLPNAVCSEMVISCSLEEWHHIFKMRCDIHAQWEIREAMMELLVKFQKFFPRLFDDFVISEDKESASLRVGGK
jgi:thymidylate synthase (FAD)